MLSLVVNNAKRNTSTCQTDCMMYDGFTNQCGYWKNIEVDNPKVFFSCEKKVLTKSAQNSKEHYWKEHMESSFSNHFNIEGYPFAPSKSIDREDAYWYVSEDKMFGCWVINKSKNIVSLINHNPIVSSRQYPSPIPLHDHEAPEPIASLMCWYVNEYGIGEYTMIKGNNLVNLS